MGRRRKALHLGAPRTVRASSDTPQIACLGVRRPMQAAHFTPRDLVLVAGALALALGLAAWLWTAA